MKFTEWLKQTKLLQNIDFSLTSDIFKEDVRSDVAPDFASFNILKKIEGLVPNISRRNVNQKPCAKQDIYS